jgi:NADH dehydrogenase/NADH:ubiquinone oxidoreductase subunit G
MNIADTSERERVIREIRVLRDQYAGTAAEYKAPNGVPSLLLDELGEDLGRRAWYAVRTTSFKEWFGDWEKIVDLTIDSSGATLSTTKEALFRLAGKDLVNLETGITARIGSTQRSKIISTAALNKTLKNGFTAQQHNAAAAHIDKLWKHAEQIEEHPDKGNDANIKSVKRFAAPVIFGEETGIAYLTVKESLEHGHRIYSIELQEIKKPRLKGSTLEKRTTAEASKSNIAQKLEEVKGKVSQNQGERIKKGVKKG